MVKGLIFVNNKNVHNIGMTKIEFPTLNRRLDL